MKSDPPICDQSCVHFRFSNMKLFYVIIFVFQHDSDVLILMNITTLHKYKDLIIPIFFSNFQKEKCNLVN